MILMWLLCFLPVVHWTSAQPEAPKLQEMRKITGVIGIDGDLKTCVTYSSAENAGRLSFSDIDTGRELSTLNWDRDWGTPTYVSFGCDYYAVTTGRYRSQMSIRVFSRKNNELIHNIRTDDIVYYAKISPNDRYLLLIGNTASVHDLEHPRKEPMRVYGIRDARPVASSNIGHLIAFPDGGTKGAVAIISLPRFQQAWSQLPVGAQYEEILNATRRSVYGLISGNKKTIESIAFSGDAKKIALVTDDTISIYEIRTGKLQKVLIGHKDIVLGCAFHPTKPILASFGRDKAIRLWDINSGKTISTIKNLDETTCWGMAFSIDGKKLMYSSRGVSEHKNRVYIWRFDDDKK